MTEWSWKTEFSFERADRAIFEALQKGWGVQMNVTDHYSRSQIQKWILEGYVRVDGKSIKPHSQLKSGVWVQISFPPPPDVTLTPEPLKLDILFEDEHLIIVNKPAGLTVHPSPTQSQGTLVHALLHYTQELSHVGGEMRPGIVHRLDQHTSGALVVAKNDLTHHHLTGLFARHDIERCYWALCYGAPADGLTHRIESKLGRDPQDRKKMSMQVQQGKKAVTYFRKKEEFLIQHGRPFASWLEMTLETGRTHQIRVHLMGSGYSILGDPVYGHPRLNQAKWKALPNAIQERVSVLPGQALHARILGFRHPMTQERIIVEAPPPEMFATLLESLQEYSH